MFEEEITCEGRGGQEENPVEIENIEIDRDDLEDSQKVDNHNNNGDTEESDTIRFYPPAYIQRYNRVREALEKRLELEDSLKSILEVGCAELSMHQHLKNLPNVEKLMYLDIDRELLERMKGKTRPLPFESLIKRETPLVVEVYSGCITKCDERVKKSDPPLFAIVGIEILEHLDTNVEIGFIHSLFEKYAPPLIILTTPNGDFNTVLGLEPGKFRHWDHRFELTRQEFFDWCSLVCQHFPNYTFTIEGITQGPEGSEEYGCLSQMAIFERKNTKDLIPQPESNQSLFKLNSVYRVDRNENPSPESCVLETLSLHDNSYNQPYKLIERYDYPWLKKPPVREQVREEIKYHINHYTLAQSALEEFWENRQTKTTIPVRNALQTCQSMLKSKENEIDHDILLEWLKEDGYQIEGKPGEENIIIQIPSYEEHTKGWFSSEEEEEYAMNLEQQENVGSEQSQEDEDWG